MGQLTAAMAHRQLSDIETTKITSTSSNDTTTKYNNLPPIIKSIIATCTMVPCMSQTDLDEIESTDNLRSFIGIKSGTSTISSTLQHTLRSKGCTAYLQNGMCNDIKNGIIASNPDPFERNGLCVFLTAPEELKQVKTDRKAELEEKSARNKLSAEDTTLLTTNDAYLPRDFWAFEHMVRNFIELVAYLLGPECLITRAWRQILEHAQKKQALYKQFEREERYFFTCLLDELYRRTQTFIHSGADGLVSWLDFEQLSFHDITRSIDNYSHQVKRSIHTYLKRKYDSQNTNPTPN